MMFAILKTVYCRFRIPYNGHKKTSKYAIKLGSLNEFYNFLRQSLKPFY